MMRHQLQMLLCSLLLMVATLSSLTAAARIPLSSEQLELRAADQPNKLEAVRILKAAAAAVTPKFGKGGHKARRDLVVERSAATPSQLEAARILKAAAAAVTPGFGAGGHKARNGHVPRRHRKRAAKTCATKKRTTTTQPKPTTTSTKPISPTPTCGSSTYGYSEGMADLNKIMKWAYATNVQTAAQKDETVYAVLSAAARYFPELDTKDTVRYLLADINAESSFNVTARSGGRLDSGASLGLLQVSPGAGAQILPLWMGHARVSYNNYSWSETPGPCGPLLDYATGKQMSLSTLTVEDLYRPWVNIHIGAWVQSNLARTASNDPWYWVQTSKDAYAYIAAKRAYDAAVASGSGVSAALQAMNKANATLQAILVGASLPRSVLTGLGSWVAGPALDGDGSYNTPGDDISAPYFANIVNGLNSLYENKSYNTKWLDSLILTAGLVDYR